MKFTGVVVGTRYEDANGMLDWLSRVFGFQERARYVDKDGKVRQAEMWIGDTELWFSGHDEGTLWADGGPEQFIGVWVDDVDAMYERVRAAGVDAEAPVDRDYDVRSFNVIDPEGYMWGFMKRLGTGYVQRRSLEEGGLEEILAPTEA
ncbi:MAG TPA: VOC family protein [Acidimicrobiales bacterium]